MELIAIEIPEGMIIPENSDLERFVNSFDKAGVKMSLSDYEYIEWVGGNKTIIPAISLYNESDNDEFFGGYDNYVQMVFMKENGKLLQIYGGCE